jgi:putative protein-disulfide isomerase
MSEKTRSLIYVGDPMCSWCYGFTVPLNQVLPDVTALPLHLVMGGLRAYNTQVMDAGMKKTIRQHWENVAERSGQPFDFSLFERDDFIYDTEPACRAVVAVRTRAPDLTLAMYHAIGQAFYAQGRDVTQADVLADIWVETAATSTVDAAEQASNLSRAQFLQTFGSDETKELTRLDFALAQRWGIQGFPSLIALQGEDAQLVVSGFVAAPQLAQRLQSAFAD